MIKKLSFCLFRPTTTIGCYRSTDKTVSIVCQFSVYKKILRRPVVRFQLMTALVDMIIGDTVLLM